MCWFCVPYCTLHLLIGILLYGRALPTPFPIHLLIQRFTSISIGYLFIYPMSCSPEIWLFCCSSCSLGKPWPFGNIFRLTPRFFWHSLFLFLTTSLFSGAYNIFWVYPVSFLPHSWNQPLLKGDLVSFIGGWYGIVSLKFFFWAK